METSTKQTIRQTELLKRQEAVDATDDASQHYEPLQTKVPWEQVDRVLGFELCFLEVETRRAKASGLVLRSPSTLVRKATALK